MKRFTDTAIRNLKPRGKTFLATDGEGLYLRITPKGKKVWLHHYKMGNSRKWYTIGEYPSFSLKEAREKNEELALAIGRGEDPAANLNANPTVQQFFESWVEYAKSPKNKPWSAAHKRNVEYAFKADVLPKIGHMKVEEVRKRDIRALLEQVEKRAPNQALQLYRRLHRLFNVAAEKDIIEANPMANLPAIGSEKQKDRYLKFDEAKTLLESLSAAYMSPDTQRAIELILRTAQRPSEVCGANVAEFDGDWWIIPGARTKNGLEQRVFVTDKIIELFGEPNKYGFFFPSSRRPERPISHLTLSKAIQRSIEDKSIPLAPFTPHDLRRTAATMLGSMGFSNDEIGSVLNHKKRDVTGIYNRHGYDKEKRRAILALERRLDSENETEQTGKVVPFPGMG